MKAEQLIVELPRFIGAQASIERKGKPTLRGQISSLAFPNDNLVIGFDWMAEEVGEEWIFVETKSHDVTLVHFSYTTLGRGNHGASSDRMALISGVLEQTVIFHPVDDLNIDPAEMRVG